jgi:ATP adenylyltransferase/5',5'''-P-1,P-4-tetraphosphate phosphorylase II
VKQLHLGDEVEQKCEWSCILWSKDYWAAEAQKAQLALQQAKDHEAKSPEIVKTTNSLFLDSQFANTIAQIYSRLFPAEQSCSVKKFANCPFMEQRQDLLKSGTLAGVFATILHKATSYAMLDRHPLDSGLIHDEYEDVYGIDLTNFTDLENSLADGRFQRLYENVVKRALQLAGIA